MIKGKKIILLPLSERHLENTVRIVNLPEVRKFTGTILPVSDFEHRNWYKKVSVSKTTRVFAIETQDGRHVGNIGLRNINFRDRNAELFIYIDPAEWGKGYGTDAVTALLRFCFDELNLHRVFLKVIEDNKRAIRVYEKVGFKTEGVLREHTWRDGRYKNLLVMGILAGELRSESV